MTLPQNNVFTDLSPGDYQLLVTDSLGCTDSIETTILAAQKFTVTFSSPTVVMSQCDTIRLAPVINPINIVDSIRWTPSNWLDCTDCITPLAMAPKGDVTYEVRVYHNGCSVVAAQNIKVKPCGNCYGPNVISPVSNDPANSLFVISCDENITNIKWLRIYDRWGGQVFENENISPNDFNIGWNGRHNGKECGPGVYVWYAEIEYANGYVEMVKGDVTVVR
ncbi:MAG: gliding motility-associated C-terminal domain-containing protein [Saprospiraceae bacterium]|nr:gliding motility-associated C-terminal domain-containing protein [Saprospiraceae bacterium]